MPTISHFARLSKSPDGGILLDVNRGEVFSLNSVGTRIVELLQQENDTTSVAETISGEFHIPLERAQNDVADFLSCLQELQLLNESPASSQLGTGGA